MMARVSSFVHTITFVEPLHAGAWAHSTAVVPFSRMRDSNAARRSSGRWGARGAARGPTGT